MRLSREIFDESITHLGHGGVCVGRQAQLMKHVAELLLGGPALLGRDGPQRQLHHHVLLSPQRIGYGVAVAVGKLAHASVEHAVRASQEALVRRNAWQTVTQCVVSRGECQVCAGSSEAIKSLSPVA